MSSKGSVFDLGVHSDEDEKDDERGTITGSEVEAGTADSEAECVEMIEAAIAAAQPLPPSLREWEFDVWAVPENTMPGAMVALLHGQGTLVPLGVPMKPLLRLLSAIRDRYWKLNAFHNSYHGLHVAAATALLLDKTGLGSPTVLPDLERFALLMAAFAHDIDHPGVGNGYLMSVSDELAVQYSNESVLERHHAALTIALMSGHAILPQRDASTSSEVVAAALASARGSEDSDGTGDTASTSTDVMSHFSPAQQRRIRSVITAAILATDMSKHATVVIPAVKALDIGSVMAGAGATSTGDEEEAIEKQRDSIHGILLHCADLTGQVLPWDISSRWSDGVVAEFRAQAALEVSAKLTPTAHMHGLHTAKAVAKLQAGFCDFVLAPLWRAMADKFPVLTDRVTQLDANSARFKRILNDEPEPEEASTVAGAGSGAAASSPTNTTR